MVASLVVLAFLLIVGGMVVRFSNSNARSADRSAIRTEAVAAAEAGMNLARATLWNAPDVTNPFGVAETTVAIGDATVTYGGSYNGLTKVWTLYGTAQMPGENPAATPTTRTVESRVQVSAGGGAAVDASEAWSKLFVDDWQACTQIKGAATIDLEVYARGDLCLHDTSLITGLAEKVSVLGKADLYDTASIGTSSAPLVDVRVAGGCRHSGTPGDFSTPCTAAHSVHTLGFATTPPDIPMPTIDLDYWYSHAKPGPAWGCTTGSLPAGAYFDDDYPNGPDSSAPTFELASAAPYDCQVWEGGTMVGRIAWTGGNVGTLTVHGTIFFDGNIHVRPGAGVRIDYDGQATLYASGEIEVEDDVWLCGVAACDATWDPQTDLLVLVADGVGWHEGIDVEYNAKFQGGALSATELDISNGGEFWGSAISRRVEFINGTTIKHIPGGVFPILDGMPDESVPAMLANIPGSYRVIHG